MVYRIYTTLLEFIEVFMVQKMVMVTRNCTVRVQILVMVTRKWTVAFREAQRYQVPSNAGQECPAHSLRLQVHELGLIFFPCSVEIFSISPLQHAASHAPLPAAYLTHNHLNQANNHAYNINNIHPEFPSYFILHPSHFLLHTSSFILYTSSFLLHTSHFILFPSYFLLHTIYFFHSPLPL
jgi:hypothetical protein